MKNRQIAFFILVSWMMMMACAGTSSVSVQVLKPAEIHLPGVRTVAIVDFQGPDRSGTQIATLLQSYVLDTEHFDILERDKLRRIMEEQNLAMAGIVDEATAVQVGRLLGVDALIFGEVSTYEVEPDKRLIRKVKEKRKTGRYEIVQEKNEETGEVQKVRKEIIEEVWVEKPYWVRKGTVGINFRVVDVETGRLLAAYSDSRSYDSQNERNSLFGGSSTSQENLKPHGEILSSLSKTLCQAFARKIAPHHITENRYIESGPGQIAEGAKFARAGLWPEAMETWKAAVLENPEMPAVYYDLGLAYEMEGDFDTAEYYFKKAIEIKSTNRYLQALARIRKAREDAMELEEQMRDRE